MLEFPQIKLKKDLYLYQRAAHLLKIDFVGLFAFAYSDQDDLFPFAAALVDLSLVRLMDLLLIAMALIDFADSITVSIRLIDFAA